jgi:hypothetical protein
MIVRVEWAINKDTELHPLVRWQFCGGLKEADRKAFLFSNVVDAPGVTGVSLHEPLTNLQPVIIVQFADSMPSTEIWRALHGAMSFQLFCGKIVIAVDDDIDPVRGRAVVGARVPVESAARYPGRVASSARPWAAQRCAR